MRAMVKLARLTNSFAGFHHQTEDIITKSEKVVESKYLWAKMIPLIAGPAEIDGFDSEDLVMLISAEQFDFVNRLIMLSDQHRILVHAYNFYASERMRFTEQFGADMNGSVVGATFLTEEEQKSSHRAPSL